MSLDGKLRHSTEFAALQGKVANAELISQNERDRLAGIYAELYESGFVPVTIKVRFNPVQQSTETVYSDGRPIDFQLAKVGNRILSLQRNRTGKYAVMVCDNVSSCPMSPDGYKEIKLSVGKGDLRSLNEAMDLLQRVYGANPEVARGLVRPGAQYVSTSLY